MTSSPFWTFESVKVNRSDESATCGRLTFHDELPNTDHMTIDEFTGGTPTATILQLMVAEVPWTPGIVPFLAEIDGGTEMQRNVHLLEKSFFILIARSAG